MRASGSVRSSLHTLTRVWYKSINLETTAIGATFRSLSQRSAQTAILNHTPLLTQRLLCYSTPRSKYASTIAPANLPASPCHNLRTPRTEIFPCTPKLPRSPTILTRIPQIPGVTRIPAASHPLHLPCHQSLPPPNPTVQPVSTHLTRLMRFHLPPTSKRSKSHKPTFSHIL